MRWIGLVVGALVLGEGCATPKSELPAGVYESFFRNWAQVHKCSAAGKISPDTTAWTLRYMTAELYRFNYDLVLLDN